MLPQVKDIEALTQQLRLNQAVFISPQAVTLPEPALGFAKGLLVRDPDGHPLRFVE
jgi:hypothetical protein